jgi:hypothetical protein
LNPAPGFNVVEGGFLQVSTNFAITNTRMGVSSWEKKLLGFFDRPLQVLPYSKGLVVQSTEIVQIATNTGQDKWWKGWFCHWH